MKDYEQALAQKEAGDTVEPSLGMGGESWDKSCPDQDWIKGAAGQRPAHVCEQREASNRAETNAELKGKTKI